jgi:hypothetical protein
MGAEASQRNLHLSADRWVGYDQRQIACSARPGSEVGRKRKPNPGICVHCCKEVDDRNKDHVFPKAWYPETTPSGIERWTVDSCVPCNDAHAQLEAELLMRIGLCIGRGEVAAAGIPEKALRSIRPRHAETERDRRARMAARDKLRQEIVISDNPPEEGVFPNFGPQPGVHYGNEYLIIGIPEASLITLGRKIVRGLTYVLERRLLPDDDAIGIFFVWDAPDITALRAQIRAAGKTYHRGPGILIERAVAADDVKMSMWHITIFGRLKMWAVVNVNPVAKNPPAATSVTT